MRSAAILAAILLFSSTSHATVVDLVREFMQTEDAARRAQIVAAIESDPGYQPDRVRDLFHGARTCPAKPPRESLELVIDGSTRRQLALRVPTNYTPERAWPLILAYHPTGGNGRAMIEAVVRVLGPRADEFILAAPGDYQPLNVDSRRSWTPEPRATLRALRQTFHIDSDRVYVTGFSQGGYAAWSFATFFGDELAASLPVACTFDAAPEIPGFWEMLLPNCANVHVLNVWGERDALPVVGLDLKTPRGTNGELNQRLRKLTTGAHMRVEHFIVPRGGHAFEPPRERMLELLASRRAQYPRTIRHRFRYLNQSRASWVEPLAWDGEQWGLTPHSIEPRPGETNEQALGRMIDDLLGTVEGDIAGQEIHIHTKHIGELIVWFGDGTIDFDKPVRVLVNDMVVLDRKIDRDLGVCLNEARRTLDFDRLRWAGLRVRRDGTATPMTSEDALPQIIWEKPR